MRRTRTGATAIALMTTFGLLLSACSGESDAPAEETTTPADTETTESATEEEPAEEVTITWWHNSNTDPGMGYYQQVADDFMAANPTVTVERAAALSRRRLRFGQHGTQLLERRGVAERERQGRGLGVDFRIGAFHQPRGRSFPGLGHRHLATSAQTFGDVLQEADLLFGASGMT